MALALLNNLPPCPKWTASKRNMSIGGTLAVKCAVGAGRDGGVGGGVKMMRAYNINCDTVQKENNMLKKRKKDSARTHFSTSEFQRGEGPQRPPGPGLVFSKGST